MELLIVWAVILLLVIALVGARAVVVEYPWIAQVVKRLFVRVHFAQRPRSFHRVAPVRYVKRGRVTIKQKRAYQAAIPPRSIPAYQLPERDITKDLTETQKANVRKLLTRGATSNEIAGALGGDRNKRLKQIGAVKAELDAEQRDRDHIQRLRTLPRDAELETMEPVPS